MIAERNEKQLAIPEFYGPQTVLKPVDYIIDQAMQQLMAICWDEEQLYVEMFKLYNVIAWIRRVRVN